MGGIPFGLFKMKGTMKNKHTSPWAWIPTLYFAQEAALCGSNDHFGHNV